MADFCGLSKIAIVLAALPACSSVVHETYFAPTSRMSEHRTAAELDDRVATPWSGPPIQAPLYSGSLLLQAEVRSVAPRRVTIGPLVLAVIPWFPVSWATEPNLEEAVERDGLRVRIQPLTLGGIGGAASRALSRNGRFELDFSKVTIQLLDKTGRPVSSGLLAPTSVLFGGKDYDAFEVAPGPWTSPSSDAWLATLTFVVPPGRIDGLELRVASANRNGTAVHFVPVRFSRATGWSFALGH